MVMSFSRRLLAWYQIHEIPGLFLFLLIEEAGVPLLLPGDALIIAAGAQPDRSLESSIAVVLTAMIASACGSSFLYLLMSRGGVALLRRYGGYLHLNQERVQFVEERIHEHGALVVLIGRLIPGFRTPTTIVAGLTRVHYRTFVPATSVAAVIWASFYFMVGWLFEKRWRSIVRMLVPYERIIPFVLVLLGVIALVVATKAYRRRRKG